VLSSKNGTQRKIQRIQKKTKPSSTYGATAVYNNQASGLSHTVKLLISEINYTPIGFALHEVVGSVCMHACMYRVGQKSKQLI